MRRILLPPRRMALCLAVLVFSATASHAYVDDAMSFAYEAANPYAERGWIIREDAWGGDLAEGEKKKVSAQLFRGNSYIFFLGTDVEGAKMRVNIYDTTGKLAESKSWSEGKFAYAEIKPAATGTYYVVVEVLSSPEERTGWALVYGFRR